MKHESGPVPPSRYNPRLAHSLARLLCLNCLLPLLLFCRFYPIRACLSLASHHPTRRRKNKHGLGGTICTACPDRYNAHSAHYLERLLCLNCLLPPLPSCRFRLMRHSPTPALSSPTHHHQNKRGLGGTTVIMPGQYTHFGSGVPCHNSL